MTTVTLSEGREHVSPRRRLGRCAALIASLCAPFSEGAVHCLVEANAALEANAVVEAHAALEAHMAMRAGGAEGASATESGEFGGVGGSGARGAARMTGGESAPAVCKNEDPLDVLFIGNSYTHYFDMPQLLVGIAESAGCSLHVEVVAPGGSSLGLHAQSGETLSAIGARDWDVVVLQNFSRLPSQPVSVVKEKTFPHIETLVSAIRQNSPQTELLFYVTWGRRDGDVRHCPEDPTVCTFAGHSRALARGYSLYAEHFDGDLVNVGGAWARIARDSTAPFRHRELYSFDGSHPSLKGSYLAASVFFAALFKTSPEGLAYPEDLSETSARYLQKVAGALPVSGA